MGILNLQIIGAISGAVFRVGKSRWDNAIVAVVEVCTTLASDLITVKFNVSA